MQIEWGRKNFLKIYISKKKIILGKKVYNSNNMTGKNKKTMTIQINKQTKKNKQRHWQIVKTDVQQYGKMRWSLLWKETSVF